MAYNSYSPQPQNYNQGQQIPQSLIGQNNVQPLFPQPQGNVYNINSTLEVANVPVGAGVSVALCMPENTMFIKTMQNVNPMFYPYKILPYSNEAESVAPPPSSNGMSKEEELAAQLKACIDRVAALEEILKKKKGVDFDV